MDSESSVLYGMKQKYTRNGQTSMGKAPNNDSTKHGNFYDYHLRPVPIKTIRELVNRNSAALVEEKKIYAVSSPNKPPRRSRSNSSSLSISISPSKKSMEICHICYDLIGYDSNVSFDQCNHVCK